jgi:hypothetical protein
MRAIVWAAILGLSFLGGAEGEVRQAEVRSGFSACATEEAFLELMQAIRTGDEITAREVQARECHVFSHCHKVEILKKGRENSLQVRVEYSDYPVWVSREAVVLVCETPPHWPEGLPLPIPELPMD